MAWERAAAQCWSMQLHQARADCARGWHNQSWHTQSNGCLSRSIHRCCMLPPTLPQAFRLPLTSVMLITGAAMAPTLNPKAARCGCRRPSSQGWLCS